ncbi:helix-turn-helix domain-containing protein [Lacrimispora sp.]|uniref:helix-turn-helix domain-containing protein n=1 Tax=Lacrimispora sp. TaxID=2719234 RepID=UPI0028A69A66|nr:helix-turn-helix transcriptional regulator [Lacrimispora sp.]
MPDDINKRFKLLREKCNKSQEEFGKALGISKSGVSDIENGRRRVTEQHIIMLRNWNEFKINEDWVRTGNGDVFLNPEKADIAFNHFGYLMGNASAQKKAVLSALIEMMYHFPDDKWNYVFEQFNNCLEIANNQNDLPGES